MAFVDDIQHMKDINEQFRYAREFAARSYGIDPAALETPALQGIQSFVFMTPDSVIKLPRNQGLADLMSHEVAVMRQLEGKTDCATARVIDFRPDEQIMHISRIPGMCLDADKIEAMTFMDRTHLAHQLGGFIADMHAAFPTTDHIDIGWREFVLKRIEGHLRVEQSEQIRERLEDAADYARRYGQSNGTYKMLHSDLHPSNVIYGDRVGIIDFVTAKFGEPHRDFMQILHRYPEGFAEEAIKAYEDKSGVTIDIAQVRVARDLFEIYVEISGNCPLKDTCAPLVGAHRPRAHSNKRNVCLAPQPK